MYKYLDDEKAKINQSITSSKIIDDNTMESITYGLLSKRFESCMRAVYAILKNIKKKHFQQFSRKDIIGNLVNLLKRDDEYKIYNIDPILRCFYYFTDYDNPFRYDVWNKIEDQINSLFTDPNIHPKSFKIICKIFSNYLIDADKEQLIKFKLYYFDGIWLKFNESIEHMQVCKNNEELNNVSYFCQGCLRIFSVFCNRYDIFEESYPGFINEYCIQPFFNELLYNYDYMKYVTIMYIYYITIWSPKDVIYYLCNQEFIARLYSFIGNNDGEKYYLSFYSILILISLAKLHDNDIALILAQFSPFDVNVSELPNKSQKSYLHFLYHIALTNLSFANAFIASQFLESIIDPNDDCLIGNKNMKKEKFTKYISTIYNQFPYAREPIISFFKGSNPFYFFVSFIIYNQENTNSISVGIENLHDLLQKLQTNSDLSQFLREKLVERSEDIIFSLQDVLDGNDDDGVTQEVSNLINDIDALLKETVENE